MPITNLTGSVAISRATSGAGTALVAAVAGKRIRVYGWMIQAAGTVNSKFEYGDGSTQVALTGLFAMVAQTQLERARSHEPYYTLPPGAGLYLNLSENIQVSGDLQYTQG